MWEAKLEPDVISYSAGISACEKGEQWQRALALLGEMRQARLEPNVISTEIPGSLCAKGAPVASNRPPWAAPGGPSEPRAAPGGPSEPPRWPSERPRWRSRRPKTAEDGLKTAQEPPMTPQDGPKRLPGSASGGRIRGFLLVFSTFFAF